MASAHHSHHRPAAFGDLSAMVPWSGPVTEYLIDAAQRCVLFWDVMRQRGNQYREHQSMTAPNVLQYQAELMVDGRTLDRPVNYALVRIVPPPHIEIAASKRPF